MTHTPKKSLREHVEAAMKVYKGECKGEKMCPLLAGVLAATAENTTRGLELAPMFDIKTGHSKGDELVLFVRRSEYAVIGYCPFCGKKRPKRGRKK